MLARGDSQGIQSLPAASPPPFPAWARAVNAPETEAEAAFLAGAALARLDAIVRQNPPWAGVLRQRLALSAAAASVRRAGRTEDEAALRDAFHLSRPGGDPGPAGKFLLAWRELAARPTRQWRSSFAAAAEVLGVPHDEALEEAARGGRGLRRLRPAGAVRRRARFRRGAARPDLGRRAPVAWGPGRGGRGAGGLARRRRARSAAELAVRAPLARRGIVPGRRTARGRPRKTLPTAARRRASSSPTPRRRRAPSTSRGILARRAEKLEKAAPKLRAKGAGAALRALLDEDCLAASSEIGGQLSERGARRLFDRLVALGAVRELTGRATFRLYGL